MRHSFLKSCFIDDNCRFLQNFKMPHGLNRNNSGLGGGSLGQINKSNLFSRGLSLGTKFQARNGGDSDSSDDVDEKEDWGKDAKTGRGGSRRGSEV